MENECTCKKPKKYQCDKTFKHLDFKNILESHESVKLYCHFFNNKKTSFGDKYIFLHDDAFSKMIDLFHQSIFVLR